MLGQVEEILAFLFAEDSGVVVFLQQGYPLPPNEVIGLFLRDYS